MQEIRSFIAVIDDDESMCQALGRLLHLAGYEVRSYFSAESFLDDPDHAHTRFIVADIQLCGMSGFELQSTLRQAGLNPPVAFITAHDEPSGRIEAEASGCVAYLRKPFSSDELLKAIRTALSNPPPLVTTESPPTDKTS